jgi:hypothetical protein
MTFDMLRDEPKSQCKVPGGRTVSARGNNDTIRRDTGFFAKALKFWLSLTTARSS